LGLQAASHTEREAAKLSDYFQDAGFLIDFVELWKSSQSFLADSTISNLEVRN